MRQCLVDDDSLKFSRAIYGILILVAFLIQNHWLVLAVCVLFILGALSFKLNIFYQFHLLVITKLIKKRSEPIYKESAELNFISGVTAAILLTSFLFLYFGKFVNFAWILILVTALFIFLACFAGICVASLLYVLYKKIFNR